MQMKPVRWTLYLGCLALLLTSCGRKEQGQENVPDHAISPDAVKNPATASGATVDESLLPKFEFPVETYDFGSIKEGNSVSYEFKFTNSGKSDLLISSATGSCGCTVADYPKEAITPGSDGVVKVTFDSKKKSGMQ